MKNIKRKLGVAFQNFQLTQENNQFKSVYNNTLNSQKKKIFVLRNYISFHFQKASQILLNFGNN